MSALSEKLLARRERWVKAGRYEFLIRRPTRLEIQRMPKDILAVEMIAGAVHGWRGVTENDLIGGGGSDAMAFDREAWVEWISDQFDLWPPLLDEFNKALSDYARGQEAAEKN